MYVTTDRVLKFSYFETKYHEMTNQLYLGLWASNQKNKTTLFSETLKVEGKQAVFLLKAPRWIYEGFFVLSKILNFMSTFFN